MSKRHRIVFVVRGTYPFPIDMLRYDACQPLHETDSNTIANSINHHYRGAEGYEVSLVRTDEPRRLWEPTYGRWESFGWKVSRVESSPQPG
jgi:hypothetical protein